MGIVCTGAMEVLNVALSSLPLLSLALRRRKHAESPIYILGRKQEKAFKTQTTE